MVCCISPRAVPSLYQAWLALEGTHDREFCSRVRKGAGADIGASGATVAAALRPIVVIPPGSGRC